MLDAVTGASQMREREDVKASKSKTTTESGSQTSISANDPELNFKGSRMEGRPEECQVHNNRQEEIRPTCNEVEPLE
jgi:hypothetical protein